MAEQDTKPPSARPQQDQLAVHDKYANGDEYMGEVRLAAPPESAGPAAPPRVVKHGLGTYRFARGSEYTGDWADGKMHGWGVFVEEASGDRYEGHWDHGERTLGLYAFGNGDVYHGAFFHNKKHGRGVAWEGRCMFEVIYEHDTLMSKTPFVTAIPARTGHHATSAISGSGNDQRTKPAAALRPQRVMQTAPNAAPVEVVLGGHPADQHCRSSRAVTTAEYDAAVRVIQRDAQKRRDSARSRPKSAGAPRPRRRASTAEAEAKGLEFERSDILRDKYRFF
jgi:hypothetical protein